MDLINNIIKLNKLKTKSHLYIKEIANLKAKAINITILLTDIEKNIILVDSCSSLKAA